ncbi:hypothetical protein T11_11663 [Trichinella zimbabwensis]|uniref:Uncharacterized protein n=1 Tax=Trichinella zimbabwensis TaxID=268475 RepID=A0A0V1GJ52_9BILA|nr:hypothetical protein T11_11663 [Trichinella zimbabwensis]
MIAGNYQTIPVLCGGYSSVQRHNSAQTSISSSSGIRTTGRLHCQL